MTSEYPRGVRSISLDRQSKFISSEFFADVNLRSRLWRLRTAGEPDVKLKVYSVPELRRIPFDEAIKNKFRETKVGEKFGPSWSTHWFHVIVRIPDNWIGEQVVFLWNSDSEAMLWSTNGDPIQGLVGGDDHGTREDYVLTKSSIPGKQYEFYVEMACNEMFGNGAAGLVNAPNPNNYYNLKRAELAVPNSLAWELLYDFQVIHNMARHLPESSVRGIQALATADRIVDTFRPDNDDSMRHGRKIAGEFLSATNGTSQHHVIAVGNCHIDTAWLWPFDETKRKVARSWSSQIQLMDKYPEFVFVGSQAQQFEWLRVHYPSVFKKVQEKAAAKQFLPIGGTWVEMDCNMPSGEAFCRQFLFGQRFFETHFGRRCKVFWLPDTFGYSAQLPQLVKLADCDYFFTQKLSWNNINKYPNTTFYWTGLDGSKVLTHMCPSWTYCAQGMPNELLDSIKNHQDLAYTNKSLLLFGNGDGGGGPLSSMIERLQRMKDVDGIPTVELNSVEKFYERVEHEDKNLMVWKGELYFELHRGTYTSHGMAKRYNRKCELLLRDAELLATLATYADRIRPDCISDKKYQYPKDSLDEAWKSVLLNQFHDVLPGSSIGMVYDDAYKFYEKVEKQVLKVREEALNRLLGIGGHSIQSAQTGLVAINTLAWPRTDIVRVPVGEGLTLEQYSNNKEEGYAVVRDLYGMGWQKIDIGKQNTGLEQVTVCMTAAQHYTLQNSYIRATFDKHGHLVSLIDQKLGRELVPEGAQGNRFVIYEDVPLFWDAWDVEIYHLQTGREANLGNAKIYEEGPLRASICLETQLTKSSKLRQVISLTSVSQRLDFETEVDWNENRKFLKVEFPFDITCDYATYETQFGYVQRPTHYNTTWDSAKFEVCVHKFADLSEYGYGVAILNDCKYGFATHGNVMRLSLLRSPKAPDPLCDINKHVFKYAVLPHVGSFLESNVVREAYEFNVPVIVKRASQEMAESQHQAQYFEVCDAPNVVLDTVKLSEDGDAIILRLYEAYGGHACAKISSTGIQIECVKIVNILEDELSPVEHSIAETAKGRTVTEVTVNFRPFQVISLKLTTR